MQNESFNGRNLTNTAGHRHNVKIKLKIIDNKCNSSNSLNYKARKIKLKYECNANIKNF